MRWQESGTGNRLGELLDSIQRNYLRSTPHLGWSLMFFIYGTDAPLYHYPITTSVMLVINVLVHVLIYSTGYDATPWILVFGDGLHPIQWLTHNFLHINIFHLLGNMIFLFPFGVIIEGKIGWLRMLMLYLAIAVGQGFVQQVIMLPSDPVDQAEELVALFDDPNSPLDEQTREDLKQQWRQDLLQAGFGSLGASAVIFGLLAVCAIWAPVNEFNVFFRWSLFVSAPDGGDREWTVATVCAIFVAKELMMFFMLGMPISSEALHLNGFVVGGCLGMAMLYLGYVDCEGFDLISIWSGSKFKGKKIIAEERRERLQAIEAATPKGPPQAVVPKMAHERVANSCQTPLPKKQPLKPRTKAAESTQTQPIPPQPTPTAFASDLSLPEFDDGVTVVDPMVEARNKIEAMVARGEFTAAVRLLAETRKQDQEFVITAAPMGRLAEGLTKAAHIKPAITVLSIGCEAYPAYEPRWRIRIASLELSSNQDPIAAVKQLQMIDKEMLDTALRNQYLKVAQLAKKMADAKKMAGG